MQVEQIRERLAQSRSQRARREDAGSRFRYRCCWIGITIVVIVLAVVAGRISDGGIVDDRADIVPLRDKCERAHESREESLALDVAVFEKWRCHVCDVVDY